MSDWTSRKSGSGNRRGAASGSTKDVVVAARLARQKRQEAARRVKAATKTQSFARTLGPRRQLEQGLLDVVQRRHLDISRVCEMQRVRGVAFVPPLPIMLDLTFKLVIASRRLRHKDHTTDSLMGTMLGFLEQALRSSDLTKGLRSILPLASCSGSSASASSSSSAVAKLVAVTRAAFELGSNGHLQSKRRSEEEVVSVPVRSRALSFLSAMARAGHPGQSNDERDHRRDILTQAAAGVAGEGPHHAITTVVLASLTDRRGDPALALELLAGANAHTTSLVVVVLIYMSCLNGIRKP
jgi:hypothetical protein